MIGEVLRAEREKQNLTIKDIEKGTSIRALYIDAIEKGNYDQLPGEVYAKGFIRNYAHFLKIDANAIMQQYMAEQHPDQVQAAPVQTPATKPVEEKKPEVKQEPVKQEAKPEVKQPEKKKEDVKSEPVKVAREAMQVEAAKAEAEKKAEAQPEAKQPEKKKVAPKRAERRTHEVHKPYTNSSQHRDHTHSRRKIFAALAVIIVVIAGAFYAMSGNDKQAPAQQPQQQQQAAQPAPQPQPDGVEVVATFSEDCWTQVTVDGKEVYEGTETKGKTETWKGQQSVAIRVGNAGAVSVKLNGNDLGKVGGEGQVVNKMYTQNGEANAQQAQAQQQSAPQQQNQAQPKAQGQQNQQKGNKN